MSSRQWSETVFASWPWAAALAFGTLMFACMKGCELETSEREAREVLTAQMAREGFRLERDWSGRISWVRVELEGQVKP